MEPPAMKAPASSNSESVQTKDESVAVENETETIQKQQTETVVKFASLLGTKTGPDSTANGQTALRAQELCRLFSAKVADDAVVLLLPSVDLSAVGGENGIKDSMLPEVGKHAEENKINLPQNGDIPAMTASVLTGATDVAATVEQKAAQNIGKQTSWTKSTLSYASSTVSSNLSESFTALLNSRVKAWTLLLLRHSLTTGDGESRKRLMGMLNARVIVNSTETTYKTLPLPESAAGQERDADVILPLLFEAKMKVSIEGKPDSVTLLAPGTVSADLLEGGLKKVIVRIDPGTLVKALSDQARIVVFKAVASATDIALPQAPQPIAQTQKVAAEEAKASDAAVESAAPQGRTASLAGFRSMLNISPHAADRSPGLQKARTSALRLSSVLQGKSAGSTQATLGPRKTRSVKWDSPADIPKLTASALPESKKQRMAQSTAKLASFKSFGRPHGGDGGPNPLNATFGDFGRQQTWDRHGRLAHHPTPMQTNVGRSMLMRDSGGSKPDKNATFDLLRLKSRTSPANQSMRTLPRTATAMESFLIGRVADSKSNSGGKV